MQKQKQKQSGSNTLEALRDATIAALEKHGASGKELGAALVALGNKIRAEHKGLPERKEALSTIWAEIVQKVKGYKESTLKVYKSSVRAAAGIPAQNTGNRNPKQKQKVPSSGSSAASVGANEQESIEFSDAPIFKTEQEKLIALVRVFVASNVVTEREAVTLAKKAFSAMPKRKK